MSYYTDKQKSKWENENKILVPYGIYYCDDDTYEWCNEDGIEVGDLHKEQRQYDSDYVEFTPYDIIYRIQKECDFIPYSFRMNNDFVENMLTHIDEYEIVVDEDDMTPPTKDDVWGSDGSYDRHIGLKDSFLYSFKEIVCEEYDWKEGWEIWEKYNSKEVK